MVRLSSSSGKLEKATGSSWHGVPVEMDQDRTRQQESATWSCVQPALIN